MSVFGQNKDESISKSSSMDSILTTKKDTNIATGIPGFDESLGQGLPAGNLYLINGDLGSSAHQFVQQILFNRIISRDKVAYYTVENSSTDIIQDMNIFGMNIQQYVDDGSWSFSRIIPSNMKTIIDVLPEVPMEQKLELDESLTKLMNNFYDMVKEGRSTAIHMPLLIRNFSLTDIQNLLFYMTGIVRRFGGIHFLLMTEGAHDKNVAVTIKDTVDAVFDVTTVTRGSEMENVITISKIRNMVPKARVVRLAQRETGLATETIRRVQ